MLTDYPTSAPQRFPTAVPPRSDQSALTHDKSRDAAQVFQDKLQALSKDKPEGLHRLRKRDLEGSEDTALAASPVQIAEDLQGIFKHEGRVDAGASASSACQPAEVRAASIVSDAAAAGPGDAFSAGLAERFAERLALSSPGSVETHVQFDAGRYQVSSVTIAGGAEEGMFLSYQGGSAGEQGAPQDEEALRQRLEARGLKVAGIFRRA